MMIDTDVSGSCDRGGCVFLVVVRMIVPMVARVLAATLVPE